MPYTAVVLDSSSYIQLLTFLNAISAKYPEAGKWKPYCHHMTLYMGVCKHSSLLEREVTMTIDSVEKLEDKVIAFRVREAKIADSDVVLKDICVNKVMHITAAVNTEVGAKPVDSNQIQTYVLWPVGTYLTVKGKIKECS